MEVTGEAERKREWVKHKQKRNEGVRDGWRSEKKNRVKERVKVGNGKLHGNE